MFSSVPDCLYTFALIRFPWFNLGLKDKDYVSYLVWSNLFNAIKCMFSFSHE